MATFCSASEPYIVSGTRGQYRVVEIPNVDHPFELTDDLKFAVLQYDGGFLVLSAVDGQRIGKSIQHAHCEWKVTGSRLILANDNGWEVFSLPDLKSISSIPSPPPLPGAGRSFEPIALARGWYCHGLIFDDAAEKIVASCRIPTATGWISGMEDTRLYAVDLRTSVMPFEILTNARHIVLHNYDRIPVPPPTRQGRERFGPRWMTMQGKASFTFAPVSKYSGVYIEFIDHDFSKCNSGADTLVGWNTPTFLLDPKANYAEWKMLALPTDTLVDVEPHISAAAYLTSKLAKTEYADTDAVLDRYSVEVAPEFELVTGQKPKNIPVAFTARFENANSLTQVVWADMTRAEVLSRFGKSIWQRETDRLLSEQNQALADNEQKISQIQATNESTRVATIASKSAWLTNSIYVCICLTLFTVCYSSLYFIRYVKSHCET